MKGAIAWMSQNSVAANLLMFLIIVAGIISATTVVQEVFPEASLDAIQIRVEYLGAAPEEVEESIVRRIEEQVEAVDGVRRITSVAAENVGVVTVDLELGTDVSEALDEIKAEIDRITTFPAEAEKPEVRELTNRRQAIQLAVYGDVPERSLKELANRIKDELTQRDNVSYVQVTGVRDYEISIEVSEETLRRYGLRLSDVSTAVRRGSLDLPGGSLETRGEEILVRTKGQNYTARDFRDIIVLARPDGTVIHLGDLARVTDGFEDADLITRFNGQPAAMVSIYRTSDERVLDVVGEVKTYLAEVEPTLPAGVSIDLWRDEAKLLQSRYDTLKSNGIAGLILVILALGLFLNTRLAFWVSTGIFISFLGVFIVMLYTGVSVNMISLFAFILALGIVVDDAIVIGEGIFALQEEGVPPVRAAVEGATRLAMPVTFAVLTTVAAFAPLLFVPGVIGKFMRNLPVIIIAVLLFSLIESLFILPAHLSHVKATRGGKKNPVAAFIERIQERVARALEWNIKGPLTTGLKFATRHYGLVIVSAVATILLSVGLVAGGFIKFTFFPDIEGENVVARIEMPEGTRADETARVAAFIEQRGREAIAELQATLPEEHPALITNAFTIVGQQPFQEQASFNAGGGPGLTQAHLAEINFELLEAESRDISAETIEQAWRDAVGPVSNVRSIAFQSAVFSLGKPIQAEISAPTPELVERAVARFKEELSQFAGVFEIEDDRKPGKREVKLSLKPQARSLGLTLEDLARQVRGAFYGDEALRIQRGRDDIRVMVRLPEDERDALDDLLDLRIRTPQGSEVPFGEVAAAAFGYGPSNINRRDRRRVVTVTANLDPDVVTAQEVVADLDQRVVPALQSEIPGTRVSFEGEQREQADTLAAITRGFAVALFLIYALLAIPLRSYVQPLVIMSAIPFGIIGAILGHLFMGLSVGILSMFGIIGLSGVVVNDSLVLIDYINQARRGGLPIREAIIQAGQVRFRPILLTSLTTFLGVLPLILERSLQAQFLVPIAVSLGFGILFATFIVLLLVPALVMLQHDAGVAFRRLLGRQTEEDLQTNGQAHGEIVLPHPTPQTA